MNATDLNDLIVERAKMLERDHAKKTFTVKGSRIPLPAEPTNFGERIEPEKFLGGLEKARLSLRQDLTNAH